MGAKAYQFKKHYTRDEARALLPRVRQWLKKMLRLRKELQEREANLNTLKEQETDVGGPVVNTWLRTLADLKDVLSEFQEREIQLKDLDRGLIDFPAIIEGKEVFLCWEDGEEDIEYWHDLHTGYAGRERLS